MSAKLFPLDPNYYDDRARLFQANAIMHLDRKEAVETIARLIEMASVQHKGDPNRTVMFARLARMDGRGN